MTDKLSRDTENEVLGTVDEQDQTVGSFDDDASVQTDAGGNSSEKKKSSSKGGIIVITVTTVVAVCLAFGYFSFFKKEAPSKAKTVKPKEDKKTEVKEEAKIDSAPSSKENGFPSDTGSNESKTAAEFLNRDTPPIAVLNEVANEVVKASPIEQPPVAVLPVAPVAVAPVVPVAPTVDPLSAVVPEAVAPVAVAPVVPVAPTVDPLSAVVPVAPVAVVTPVEAPAKVQDTSINSAFDSMATRVDSVSTRVDGLEKFKSAQEDLNIDFKKRIVRLEGFHEGQDGKSSTGTVAPKSANVKPKVVSKPKVHTPRVVKPKRSDISGDVLVDKSDVNSREEVKKANPLEKYQFHSIYDNRVWLKNSDGSLSTYTVGGRLPSGEVIKEVNHDKFEVVTNKRTIRKD